MKGQSHHTSGYQGRQLGFFESVEMPEEELFRRIGYIEALKLVNNYPRIIPFRTSNNTAPEVSQEELKVRSRVVQFLREALGNAQTVKGDNYVVPVNYAQNPESMRKDFLKYFKERERL